MPEGMMSLTRQFKLVACALVALIGTALVLTPPALAAASTGRPAAQTRAPMQPTPPGPGVAPALAPTGAAPSTNWSGYAATGTTFSSVSASWVVPTATCSLGNQYSSSWVGLDGYNSPTVEQTGTDSDCAVGAPSYYAWYEVYPAASVVLAKPVAAGDQMNASVTATTATTFALTINDATKGWTRTFTKTLGTATRTSAEVIEEAPCCTAKGAVLPLANFGMINFTNAKANGQPIGNFTHQRINMVSATGVTKATTSALAQGAFSVTWDHR
jgi:hypothetical protein